MLQPIKNNFRIYFAITLYVIWVVIFSAVNYFKEKQHLYSELDQQLENAALTIPSILPKDLHRKDMSKKDLSEQQDLAITLALSEYTQRTDIVYLYTLILRNNKIFYTSSSASDAELESNTFAFNYFEYYDDAASDIPAMFEQRQSQIHESSDKWGDFRSILIPVNADDGSVYIVGADISISHIDTLLNEALYSNLIISALFLLFACPLIITLSLEPRRQVRLLAKKIARQTSKLLKSEAKLASIFEYSPIGIMHYDIKGVIKKTNKRFEEILLTERDTLIGFNMLERLENPELLNMVTQSLQGKVSVFEGPYTSISGQRFMYLHANFAPLYSNTGELEGGIGVFNDITEKQQSTEDLKKLSMVVEYSPESIFITNVSGIIEHVNPKFTDITGYTAAEVIGKKANVFRSSYTPDSVYQKLWATILSGQQWSGELQNSKKNGELFWAQVCVVPVTNDGAITHFIGIQVDVTTARLASQKIAYQATHDMLTGLINRYEFENLLAQCILSSQQDKTTHTLIFLDLDQFKIINDTCGHMAGDEMLCQLGLLLSKHIKPKDILARLGGDEFAILMMQCSLEQAQSTAHNILELIANYQFLWEKNIFSISASIGVAEINSQTKNTKEILICVDSACYAAKDLGRNRIHLYQLDDELLAKRDGEFRWVHELKYALNENRFELYAQPIVSLLDPTQKRIYEILLRLRTRSGDIAPPGAFLPVAERYNLSEAIDRWVVDHTLIWMELHFQHLGDIDHLAINLSGASLGSSALLSHIMQQITLHHLPPSMIKFEITETAAISNLRDATLFIKTLCEFGCQFALDDFGSGLSSFAYLKNLPVTTLKIDGMFVKDILDDPIDEAMVKSINDIGHVMGMKTIAEFVENDAIRQRLKDMGVDFAQGYEIGRPVPIDDIL
ncbi:EAL domain-containing protein [Shewanella frigidimarina]|uniref:EAL domain-containing protein n=1 Tax=Shewanella frigidimarina TaxID=56812 RepID=UPI001FE1501E|nr:EAL domain-containing protein [Shewanella frigidimarina]